jgi:hypothetical protein
MWMSRFLLHRIAEIYNVEVTFDPKPIPGKGSVQMFVCILGWGSVQMLVCSWG